MWAASPKATGRTQRHSVLSAEAPPPTQKTKRCVRWGSTESVTSPEMVPNLQTTSTLSQRCNTQERLHLVWHGQRGLRAVRQATFDLGGGRTLNELGRGQMVVPGDSAFRVLGDSALNSQGPYPQEPVPIKEMTPPPNSRYPTLC